jgi:HEAT repeats
MLQICLFVALGATLPAQPPRELPTLAQVRERAARSHHGWVDHGILVLSGPQLFPLYQAILSDAKSTDLEVCGVLSVLCDVKAPKGEFLELVVPLLTHKDYAIRGCAATLLGDIATPNETSILLALLSDKESSVATSAATALEKRGGARELIAIDAWLLSAADREREWMVKYVRERRAGLAARLEAEKKEREKAKDKK